MVVAGKSFGEIGDAYANERRKGRKRRAEMKRHFPRLPERYINFEIPILTTAYILHGIYGTSDATNRIPHDSTAHLYTENFAQKETANSTIIIPTTFRVIYREMRSCLNSPAKIRFVPHWFLNPRNLFLNTRYIYYNLPFFYN